MMETGKVVLGITISLDGFIAGIGNDTDLPMGANGLRLHRWFFEDTTPQDEAVMQQRMNTTGAVILGAKTYRDAIDGAWGGQSPFHAPAFVLTHRPPQHRVEGFTFVTGGIESALEQARAAAGDQGVWLMGGANVMQQYLAAGLVDEIALHVAPMLLGNGTRLFEHLDARLVDLDLVQTVQTPAALHLRYRVITPGARPNGGDHA